MGEVGAARIGVGRAGNAEFDIQTPQMGCGGHPPHLIYDHDCKETSLWGVVVESTSNPATVPLDGQIAALAELVADRTPVEATPLAEIRERVKAGNALCQSGPDIDQVNDERLPECGLAVRRYSPSRIDATIVYLHGGGWVTGDLDFADELCRVLADTCNAEVFNVDYRLAPEFPFPVPLEDAWQTLTEISRIAGSDRPLIVAGDSAGGNLAALCANRARHRGHPEVSGQVLIYPVTDSVDDYDSYVRHEHGFPIGRGSMAWFWSTYAPEPSARRSPEAAPMLESNLEGVAPALVVLAGHDPLHDEGEAYARRLGGAGVDVEVLDYPALCHGFVRLTGASEAAMRARGEIAEAVTALIARIDTEEIDSKEQE